jgi:uncharacterized glyoxalase superfamily protein PhnB/uncharacterized protein YndB with AHSA1/START domain
MPHALTITRTSPRSAATLYRAWTTLWHAWLAEADTIRMQAEAGAPFFFDVVQRFPDGREPVRHAHYGRFLRLVPDALVSLTWVTGAGGTTGAETTLTVHLDAVAGDFTQVTLTHEGFATEQARDTHEAAWRVILAHQDSVLGLDHDHDHDTAAAPVSGQYHAPWDATFIPIRSYPDLDAAVHWLHEVFNARERLRVPGQRVQLTVGNGTVVVAAWNATAHPATGGRPPAVLMVRVPNVDTAYVRAVALGGASLAPPADLSDGERQATVRDPAGHTWTLTHRPL